MPSASGHYDQALLASAPAATKAQLQEGYTTDLLNSSQGNATPPPLSASQADVERGLVHKEYNNASPRALPFWRTRKGMIIIFVAIIVILAAVIGGAVGGTAGKKKDSSPNGNSGEATPSGGTSEGADQGGSGSSTTSRIPQSTVTTAPDGGIGESPATSTPTTSRQQSTVTELPTTSASSSVPAPDGIGAASPTSSSRLDPPGGILMGAAPSAR